MINVRKYNLYLWLGFACPIVVLVNAMAKVLPAGARKAIARGMAKWWASGMIWTAGATCSVEGLTHIEGEGPYIVMSNHRSHMDTPLLIRHIPFLFGFIVKKELMKIPVFATAMKSIGCVAVSRGKSRSDYSGLDSVAADVAGGKNILVFPEGTRAPGDEFLPFKKGGVIVAIKAGVPILPVAVSGTGRVIPARKLRVNAGSLLLKVGAPIETKGLEMDDRDELITRVQAAIEALYVPGYGGPGV